MIVTLRCATWNIGSLCRSREENARILTDVLTADRPDCLFLQEYVPEAETERLIGKCTGLRLCYFSDFSDSHVARGARMGIAVFSRGEAAERARYRLVMPERTFRCEGRDERFHDKYFLDLAVSLAGKTFGFLTGHGYSFHRYGEDPAAFPEIFAPLDAWLAARSLPGTVVPGDFNVDCAPRLLPAFCASAEDIFAGEATRPGGWKSDYIFVPKGTRYRNKVNVLRGNAAHTTGFDHNYLAADIEMHPRDGAADIK